LADLDLLDRFDAEYFQPAFLSTATALEGRGRKLEELGTLTCSAFYPAATQLYEIGDVPFVRCVDVVPFPVITGDQPFERVPRDFVEAESGVKTLDTDDIVITKVGTPCYAGVIHESLGYCALTRTVLGVQDLSRDLVDPYYLVAFLRSKFGFYQLMREREQQIQLQLTLERVGRINVFLPPLELQQSVGDIVRDYHRQTTLSKALYAEAEALLLTELGLHELDLSHQPTYTQSFSQAWTAGRLDAEHFQPKYYRVLEAISSTAEGKEWPIENIGRFSEPLKYGTSTKLEYLQEGVPFLRIADVSRRRFSLDSVQYISGKQAEEEKRASVRTGDVLISRSGTLGLTVAIPAYLEGAIFGSYFIRARPDDKRVVPKYLALFMNSLAGQTQVERLNTGAIQTNLTIPAIESIQVPLPPLEVQKAIAGKVLDSFAAEDEAKRLLEEAKRRVEELVLREES
jgi:restriction endonuclease S subunit